MTDLLHQRILDEAEQYYLLAEKKLGRTFARPAVKFTQRGAIAGSARLQINEIRLNPKLLVQYPEVFVSQVLPHEISHLLVFTLYGKVRPHGKQWQTMMQHVFGCPPQVRHSMDVSKVAGKTFAYRCKCGPVSLSIRRHNKVVRQQQQYLCRRCGETLTCCA